MNKLVTEAATETIEFFKEKLIQEDYQDLIVEINSLVLYAYKMGQHDYKFGQTTDEGSSRRIDAN